MLVSEISTPNKIQTGTTTSNQSGIESNGNEDGTKYFPDLKKGLMLSSGHSLLRRSYSSAENTVSVS